MSRDVKGLSVSQPPKKRSSLLTGLLIGLVVGTLAAAGVAWYVSRLSMQFDQGKTADAKAAAAPKSAPLAPPVQPTPAPAPVLPVPQPEAVPQVAPAPAAAPTPTAPPRASSVPVPVATTPAPAAPAAAPLPLPGKPGDKVADDKPRFEFYKALPGDPKAPKSSTEPAHVPVAPVAAEKPSANKPSKASDGAVYIQVGAFQNPAEADNMKARLALMGLEAGVQPVNVPDKGTLHRVRLGPYAKADDASAVRDKLTKAGIPVAVVK